MISCFRRFSLEAAVGVLSVTCLACGGAGAETSAASPAAAPAAPVVVSVSTAPSVERSIPTVVRTTGTFVADESSEVTPQVAGSVIETPVNVGDRVRAGQVIVRLDPRNARLDLSHAQAALQQVEAQAQNAKIEAARHATLVESGDISRSNYEKLTTQLATAEAAVAQARARVASVEKAVEDTTIVAPFDGHVSARPVAVGEYVNTSSKVATIVRIQPIKLELQVPESDAARLRAGLKVQAEVPAYPGITFTGAVSARNVAIDPSSRAMTVEVRFPNADAQLTPGMFATAEVQLPATESAIYVPREAITSIANGESTAVYVIDGATARVRVVQAGEASDGMVRVFAGLEVGSTVATSRLDQLFDGAPVQQVAASASAAGAR